ncbi:DUF6286 domain-containing protein [Streptomyces sp. NPDC005271]|uniref:DUF6286 domain-containing protein n=1 Tax=unclassified Streptomyces TaxID=2593676 RepID=UPI0033B39741
MGGAEKMRQSASSAVYEAGPRPGSGSGTGPGSGPDDSSRHGHVGRFWSERRIPAGLVALALVAIAGLLLYEVAAVRAGRSAMRWRDWLAEQLASRPLDDAWVMGGAALLALLGLWMIVLALTPGLRGLLPMRAPSDVRDMRAGIDRAAARLVLRDRAMEVPGVRSVRVDVGRRRVRARALAHFRDLDEVRADLDAALDEGIRQLGLARRPALSVHVRRPAKG